MKAKTTRVAIQKPQGNKENRGDVLQALLDDREGAPPNEGDPNQCEVGLDWL